MTREEKREFKSILVELIDGFRNNNDDSYVFYEGEDDDYKLYTYENEIECDADLYNDDGFAIKAEAKVACKKAISDVLSDMMHYYDMEKKELIDDAYTYYTPFKENLFVFHDKFISTCIDSIKKYWPEEEEWIKEAVEAEPMPNMDYIAEKFDKAFQKVVKKHFTPMENESLSLDRLLEMCDIDEEEGEYYFDVGNATDFIVLELEKDIMSEQDLFPKSVFKKYSKIKDEYIGLLWRWMNDQCNDLVPFFI
ncbi:hypothetical protein [Eubacterium xylanophilum]|uniref:hypothetical protein n=1 Tax=Eubacterium xylanophilum TaxID=39497 RepID=UPI0004BBF06E|nr:hypothetical protein [Eubacterium xylanophilum]